MLRVGLLGFMVLGLAGCAMFDHDLTLDPDMNSLVGHSYRIVSDSFLLENYCLNDYTTTSCLYMQIAGGFIEAGKGIGNSRISLPKSFVDYEQHKDYYNDGLKSDSLFHHTKHDIVAEIPKGTIIRITRVVSVAEGENGRGWAIYGQIASQGSDVSIQIGSGHLRQSGPRWFHARDREYFNRPPQPLPEFLLPLDGS
ncbi:MAG TPA: hypothetical protein VF117_05765 [Gammaproteobacteria bacterium]